jgi:hypothetical protein
MFIKVFRDEKDALRFAALKNAKVIVRYDWDNMTNRLIKEFVVKF